MSTIFEVFPCNDVVPTFKEVLDLANQKLKEFLENLGIFEELKLSVQLRKNDESIVYESILANKTIWSEDYYAWFFVDGIPGGTGARFGYFDKSDIDVWNEEIETNPTFNAHVDKMNKCLELGYNWQFRRSAGQPGIINLSYGLLAASLCKLTNGLIYSDDGAWDYSLFPTTADDFFSWYFKSELTANQEYLNWSKKCIQSIYKEISCRS